jgi:hypothetical protein
MLKDEIKKMIKKAKKMTWVNYVNPQNLQPGLWDQNNFIEIKQK